MSRLGPGGGVPERCCGLLGTLHSGWGSLAQPPAPGHNRPTLSAAVHPETPPCPACRAQPHPCRHLPLTSQARASRADEEKRPGYQAGLQPYEDTGPRPAGWLLPIPGPRPRGHMQCFLHSHGECLSCFGTPPCEPSCPLLSQQKLPAQKAAAAPPSQCPHPLLCCQRHTSLTPQMEALLAVGAR